MVKELLKHLLFSEVINENVKLNKYIELVQNIENKTFLEKNFDRETILIFELAIDDKFDPWDIDITKFVKLYLQRLQNEKNINLCLAGYLILLCWHILKIQSSKIIDKYTLKNQIEMLSWDAIPDWHETSQQPTITPLLTRNETKKITFYDFIKAFEDIKNKISTKELQTQINAHYKKEFFANAVKLINSSVHPENIENYIGKLWQKISHFKGNISISKITNGYKEEFIETFIGVVHLANKHKIDVWQDDFPYGNIYLKVNGGKRT